MMKRITYCCSIITLLLTNVKLVFPQSLHLGVFGGAASYSGDLVDKYFPGKGQTKEALGITFNYELAEQFILRAGFTHAKFGGADSLGSKANLKLRNLSFETSVAEFSLMGEFYPFSLYDRSYSPYLFGGIAVFHFNPYAYHFTGNKLFLQPLSTEGQGLPGYTSRPYKLTQFAIPFGGGIKFAITEQLRIGVEFQIRKLFTDYLDDLSTNYADEMDLLNGKGQFAVDMAYRGDEVTGGSPIYPTKGAQRGSDANKDFYYTLGVHLTYNLSGNNGGGNYLNFRGRSSRKNGCPGSPM